MTTIGRNRRAREGVAAVALIALCTACTQRHAADPTHGARSASPTPGANSAASSPSSTLRVHLRFTYSHPAGSGMTSYDGPGRGDVVVVQAVDKPRHVTATTGSDGNAIVHPKPGIYVVYGDEGCPTPRKTIAITPGATRSIRLVCVAP